MKKKRKLNSVRVKECDPESLLKKANRRTPMTTVEVAAFCGVSATRVDDLEKRALAKAKKQMKEIDP